MDKAKEVHPATLALAQQMMAQPQNSANSTIQVNAGGLALWAAVTACLVMLAVTIVLAVFVAIGMSDLNRQTQELREANEVQQAYINAAFSNQTKEPE